MKCPKHLAVRLSATAVWVVVLLVGYLPTSPAFAATGACSNEARRAEQSSLYLANCRAYEQVSPREKDSGEPNAVNVGFSEREPFAPVMGAHAAVDGSRMAWDSEYALPGVAGPSSPGLDYLSTRGAEGWSTEATVPPQSPENGTLCPILDGIVGWSSNLTRGVLNDGYAQETGSVEEAFYEQGHGCGHDEPRLVANEPEGFENLFLWGGAAGSYQLLNVTPSTAPHPTPRQVKDIQEYFPPNFLAGSADLNEVVFEDELPLTEEAEHLTKLGEPEQKEFETACDEEPKGRACWEGHDDTYVWSEGQQTSVRLVSVLPDGVPVAGVLAGSTRNNAGTRNVADFRHAVSADGSRVFFEAEGNLYVRENAGQQQSALGGKGECTEPSMACTIQLDLPQGSSGPGGGGKWLGSNAEGTEVFFTDEAANGLTSTTMPASGVNLYEYELPSQPDTSGTLLDLTPDAKAEVLGMSGLAEDGSYVYFVADGALPGSGENSEKEMAQAGQPNLYVSHEGQVAFIATLNVEDLCDWTSNTGCNTRQPSNPRATGLTTRVSGNGRYLAFNSVNRLTEYENIGPACSPVYGSKFELTGYGLGSCEEILLYEADGNHLACVSCRPNGTAPEGSGAVIDWAAGPDTDDEMKNVYPQRNVSESGQVFFETKEGLLPQATNGQRDVYEYEHGALHLISSGTSSAPSYFLDASPSGNDVFIATAQKLLPRDTDAAYDVYDVRVDGGFPEPVPTPAPCESEACKAGAAASAVFSAPSSTTFAGPGNIVNAKTSPKPKSKKRLKAKKPKRRHKSMRRRRASRNQSHRALNAGKRGRR